MTPDEDSPTHDSSSNGWRIDLDRPKAAHTEAHELSVMALNAASQTLAELSHATQAADRRLSQMILRAERTGLTNSEIAVAAQVSLDRVQATLEKD